MGLKISNETKTGVLVLICLAALVGLLIKVGNFSWFKEGYILKTRFHFTGGVKKSAPIRLSGVDVGEVKNIRLLNEGNETVAEVDMWFEEGTLVRKDAKAIVSTLGLMGEKYIELQAGTSPEFAAKGDMIAAEDPVRLEELIDIGKKVAVDIGDAAKKIGTTAEDISKVANHVDEAVLENRPKLNAIFDNFEETSENFNDFSQDVKYHPWKVLMKGKEVPKDQMVRDREVRRVEKAKARGKEYTPQIISTPSAADEVSGSSGAVAGVKKNFGPAR